MLLKFHFKSFSTRFECSFSEKSVAHLFEILLHIFVQWVENGFVIEPKNTQKYTRNECKKSRVNILPGFFYLRRVGCFKLSKYFANFNALKLHSKRVEKMEITFSSRFSFSESLLLFSTE